MSNQNFKPRYTKNERLLQEFLTRSNGMNTFEAQIVGDSCLNSSVSFFRNQCGIEFHAEWESVKTRFGSNTHCKRYRLTRDGRLRARAYLAAQSEKRAQKAAQGA